MPRGVRLPLKLQDVREDPGVRDSVADVHPALVDVHVHHRNTRRDDLAALGCVSAFLSSLILLPFCREVIVSLLSYVGRANQPLGYVDQANPHLLSQVALVPEVYAYLVLHSYAK